MAISSKNQTHPALAGTFNPLGSQTVAVGISLVQSHT